MLTARAELSMEMVQISFDTTPFNMLHMNSSVHFLRFFHLLSQPPKMYLSHIFYLIFGKLDHRRI